MINKTLKFFISYFIVIAVLLSVVFASKSIVFKHKKENTYNIDFLNVSNQIIDSLLSNLTISEKLDLIVKTKNSELGFITDSSLNFVNFETLNSISDTIFLKEYLTNLSNQNFNNYYVKFNLLKADSLNMTDSNYIDFTVSRFKLINKTFSKKNIIFAAKLPQNYFKLTKNNQNKHILFLDSLFRKDLPIINIDFSENTIKQINHYNALIVANFDSIYTQKDLISFINSNINIIEVDTENKKEIIEKFKTLIKDKHIDNEKINYKLRKILKAKYWHKQTEAKANLHSNDSLFYITKRYNYLLKKKSLTLLSKHQDIVPVKNINNKTFNVYADYGKKRINFLDIFKFYSSYNQQNLDFNKLKKIKNRKEQINIFLIDKKLKDSIKNENTKTIFKEIPKNSIIVNFGNYSNLKYFSDSATIIQLAGNTITDFNIAAQAIFGGIKISGHLPYNVSNKFYFNTEKLTKKTRLSYTIPEEAGVDAKKLAEIDKIANEGVARGAFPGCQVFVAKNGKVIYNKSFGNHTYSKRNKVKWNDVYDIASVTKIAATTIATMKMIDNGKMRLNSKLGDFFKDTKIDYTRIKPDTVVKIDTFFHKTIKKWNTFLKNRDTVNITDTSFFSKQTIITKLTPRRNIFKVKLVDLLKHKSGIIPSMPIFRYMYYRNEYFKHLRIKLDKSEIPYKKYIKALTKNIPDTIDKSQVLPDSIKFVIKKGLKDLYSKYFSNVKIKDSSDIQLARNLYFRNEYFDTIWRDTKQLPVYSRKVFQYSDVNMILLQLAIDSLNNSNINKYLQTNFFKPLSIKNIGYLPLNRFSKQKIVPTEIDDTWRHSILQGFVHDPSSSLMGGMVGNAGLYSNAHDLGILFQMVLNGGTYGNKRFLKESTIKKFTTRLDDTQRGLGFDMPNRKAILGSLASENTYGHSGYTGTCVWVDPDTELVYVFLSNRNHPSSKNWRIISYHIRERIHDAVYKAIVE